MCRRAGAEAGEEARPASGPATIEKPDWYKRPNFSLAQSEEQARAHQVFFSFGCRDQIGAAIVEEEEEGASAEESGGEGDEGGGRKAEAVPDLFAEADSAGGAAGASEGGNSFLKRRVRTEEEREQFVICLRGETKGSKIKGKMEVKWESRDRLDGHHTTASRCVFYL